MKAMKSSNNFPMNGDVEVDATVFGGQEERVKGRTNIHKQQVVVGIEKKRKGVSRHTRQIDSARAKNLGDFMQDYINFLMQKSKPINGQDINL